MANESFPLDDPLSPQPPLNPHDPVNDPNHPNRSPPGQEDPNRVKKVPEADEPTPLSDERR
ncbi:hypothetical protein [Pseudomonas sp. R5(2019)]|uniref:hypothetical protein n=1 Tax=Pseudomonas sp. R5(2019) TaxID=2697566 RepID=UPI001411FB04|nr:hypothetical protein [Pseudomonas sp. R5(2019)]NBA97163.1 hypothetical protein [Pseudomonas sp. R5(2019)]